MSNIEQTLSIIKPDAVERNLTEDIKKILQKKILVSPDDNEKTLKARIQQVEYKAYAEAVIIMFK